MVGILFSALIYLIPLSAIIFFIASLCNFIGTSKCYKTEPTEANKQKKSAAKTLLIVSSIIMGVLVAVIVAFMMLMVSAVAYM